MKRIWTIYENTKAIFPPNFSKHTYILESKQISELLLYNLKRLIVPKPPKYHSKID
jgi:hypothetical protein